MKVKVRFAPSPTGYLHIGGLRTALYNFLFARHEGGEFLLRIEDTDRERYVPDAEKDILEMLAWAGLKWDNEVVDHQSAHLDRYREYAEKLVASGNGYYCSCTTERLSELRKEQALAKLPMKYDGKCRPDAESRATPSPKPSPAGRGSISPHPHPNPLPRGEGSGMVVRLKVPHEGETGFEDLIHGQVRFENKLLDDQVLLKSDGFPTYHLANVVDDHLMRITHVIRGEEWIPSTPKHVLLYRAFGWEPPQFAHLPLLLSPQGGKLSKRQTDVAARDYKEKGYLPEALVNFVALLGWNPTADREIFSLEELTASFDLRKVNKAGTVVNLEKLNWLNKHFIRTLTDDALVAATLPYLVAAGAVRAEGGQFFVADRGVVDRAWITRVCSLEKERLENFSHIVQLTTFFFARPEYDGRMLIWKKADTETTVRALAALKEYIASIDAHRFGESATLEHDLKSWIASQKFSVGEVLWPLRVALTGREASPGPTQVGSILGKEEVLARVALALHKLLSI